MMFRDFRSAVFWKLAFVCGTFLFISHARAQVEMATPAPEVGTWINETNGDVVGVQLVSSEECNLFIERLLQPRSIRACKYERHDSGYALFLVGKDGLCGSEPDFQFYYDPQGPLIRLDIGGSELLLHKT